MERTINEREGIKEIPCGQSLELPCPGVGPNSIESGQTAQQRQSRARRETGRHPKGNEMDWWDFQ